MPIISGGGGLLGTGGKMIYSPSTSWLENVPNNFATIYPDHWEQGGGVWEKDGTGIYCSSVFGSRAYLLARGPANGTFKVETTQ